MQRTLRLTVLGCGTSTGVPVPGCTCNVCLSGKPKNARLRTSSVVELPSGEVLLIDAGPDLRYQALRQGLKRVDGVFFTHAHSDHILGTDDLRVFNFSRPEPIPIYGNEQTLSTLESLFHYIFHPDPNYKGGILAKLAPQPITPLRSFPFFGETITPFELVHGRMTVLGFRLGGLVYATDCNAIPEQSRAVMRGAKVLLLDGLRFEAHPTHFTIDQAIEIAKELEAETTYLIHMTHNIDYDEVSASLPPGVHLAYDGLQLESPL